MSWSLSAIGKPVAVGVKIMEQASGSRCMEPEETIRQAALAAIMFAVKSQDPAGAIKVIASGSQSEGYEGGKPTGKFTNGLNITVEPLYGFLE